MSSRNSKRATRYRTSVAEIGSKDFKDSGKKVVRHVSKEPRTTAETRRFRKSGIIVAKMITRMHRSGLGGFGPGKTAQETPSSQTEGC